ncbi:unnamed protein product [Camellia sinensis]
MDQHASINFDTTPIHSTVHRESLTQEKSSEEEDHLIRSTKKIKSSNSVTEGSKAKATDMETELPNDDLGEQRHQDMGFAPPKSFKEALTSVHNNDYIFYSRVDILSSNKEDDEDPKGQTTIQGTSSEQQGLPTISLPKKLLDKIRKPWENALIIRLLGKNIGYKMLCSRVRNLWGLQGEFNAIDLGCNYFLFKFSDQTDCANVFTGGPWVIMDHYLTVRRWEPNFRPSEAFETTTAVWVRFPKLPIEYYQEKVLFAIAKTIDKPFKIDWNTAMATRGKFARVCVEMDLSKLLKPKFLLEGIN